MDTNEETLSLEEAASTYASTVSDESQEDHTEETTETEGLEPVEDIQEDDVEDEEGEQDEDQDSQEEDAEEDDSYEPTDDYQIEVKLPDGTTASIQDLINGNEGRADITRKQQAIAEQNKVIAERQEKFQEQEQFLAERNEMLAQYLHSNLPPMPAPELVHTDIVSYTEQKALYDQKVGEFRQFEQQFQQSMQEKQAEEQRLAGQKMEALYADLYKRKPELRDQAKFQAYEQEMVKGIEVFGADAQTLSRINEPWQLRILEAALAYNKIQANTKKPAKKGKRPPVIRGSKSKPANAGKVKAQRVAINRLSKSANLNDGVAALMALEKE